MTLSADPEHGLGVIMVVNEPIKMVMFSRTISELKYTWVSW